MREQDFKQLTALEPTKLNTTIHPRLDFFSHYSEPRTLFYGYDCDRNTHHVYSDNEGNVILHVYKDNGDRGVLTKAHINYTEEGIDDLSALMPNKRLYPQYCDFDACWTLKEKGISLPFTVFEEARREGPYYGKLA